MMSKAATIVIIQCVDEYPIDEGGIKDPAAARPPQRDRSNANAQAPTPARHSPGETSAEARQPQSNANARFPSSGAVYGNGGRSGQQDGHRGRRGSAREVPALLGGSSRRNG